VTGAHQESVLVSWPSPDIGVVTLNRPERLNALTHDVVDALVARLTEAGAAPECRVLVLTGAGRGFCAGLDIAANIDADADVKRSLPVRMAGQEKFASMIRTIRTLRQPVVAAVWQTTGTGAGDDFAWIPAAPQLAPAVDGSLFAVPAGPSPALVVTPAGKDAVAVSVAPADGGTATTVSAAAGRATVVPLAAGRAYRIALDGAAYAAVAFAGDGALASYPVWPQDAASAPVVVYP